VKHRSNFVENARLKSIGLEESISRLKTERGFVNPASSEKLAALKAIDRFDERHESASTCSQQVRITSDGFVFRVVRIRARRFSETEDLIRWR
jgi:hypothetical protein